MNQALLLTHYDAAHHHFPIASQEALPLFYFWRVNKLAFYRQPTSLIFFKTPKYLPSFPVISYKLLIFI
jgi:hypothetical protein